jgi:hypothetical protein
MRSVGEKLGNTAAVARSSYVSPAVIEQHLDGRRIDDFRPRHLRMSVRATLNSTWKSKRCSPFYVPGAFASRAQPRRISGLISVG